MRFSTLYRMGTIFSMPYEIGISSTLYQSVRLLECCMESVRFLEDGIGVIPERYKVIKNRYTAGIAIYLFNSLVRYKAQLPPLYVYAPLSLLI